MGMSPKESLAVGYGMIPRGEVGLIIALVAVQQGIIGSNLFSILVIVLLLVSVLPAPLLRRALRSIRPEATSVPAEESSSDPA
jgi:Kef-type K+ transport system membrane component KefB